MVRRVLFSSPSSEVRELCEMCSSERLVRVERPEREVRRLDGRDRMRRLVSGERFWGCQWWFGEGEGEGEKGHTLISVILFRPSHSSSRETSAERFWISCGRKGQQMDFATRPIGAEC